jgi:hypothetical protein
VEPVFGDRRHERRNLDDLVTTRSRTIREQIPAATLRALLGLVVDDIIDLVLVDQLSRLAGVTGLTALLLARGRTATLAALGPWPIRGRRLRRVPRVATEPGLQLLDLALLTLAHAHNLCDLRRKIAAAWTVWRTRLHTLNIAKSPFGLCTLNSASLT